MKRLSLLAALSVSMLLTPLATAQSSIPETVDTATPQVEPLRVVELFTSQGCSSCPPSNDLITDWASQDGVLALTYSVDYWDYLGWRDSFADPKFTARQRAYAKAIGHGRVYTPQIVINGAVDRARFSAEEVMSVTLAADRPAITRKSDGQIGIASSSLATLAQIKIVHYSLGTQDVAVKGGENGGRTLSLTNVVTDITDAGAYTGAPLSLDAPQNGAFAVIIQNSNAGSIISAANFTP